MGISRKRSGKDKQTQKAFSDWRNFFIFIVSAPQELPLLGTFVAPISE